MTASSKHVASPADAAQGRSEAPVVGWYLYGITLGGEAEMPWQAITATASVDATTMRALTRGELVAVVRSVALADFEPDILRERLSDLTALETMARAHNAVIAAIHEQQPILPAKFGSVYASLDELGASLDDAQTQFLDALRRLDGCDEWAIHLYADQSLIAQRVVDDDPELQRLRAEIEAASPGRAYFLQRKLTGAISAAVENKLLERERDMIEWLRPLTRGVVSQTAAVSGGKTQGDEVEIMRAALLIDRTRRDDLLRALQARIGGEAGLRLEIGGPWPPYSFASEPEEDRDEP
ncbi:MAG TPA: GvpL/GvpF family gas vesicle protein [Nitrolancea sp.]|nr:GvpL/GvpF family gas vesicle protein [Nitrolancea sp.]